MAYERAYGPLGGRRDDYLAAMISATVAASMGGKEMPLSGFMPSWPGTAEEAAHGDDS